MLQYKTIVRSTERILSIGEVWRTKYQSTHRRRIMKGIAGDKLVLDRKGPGKTVRMRVVRSPDSEPPPRDVSIVPHPWRPITLKEEIDRRRASPSLEDGMETATSAVMEYVGSRLDTDYELDAVYLCDRLWDYFFEDS